MLKPRGTRRYRPILGTVEALVSSGDLNLIPSNRLRAELVAYLESTKTNLDDISRFDETYYRPGVLVLYRGLDIQQFVTPKAAEDQDRVRPSDSNFIPFPTTLEVQRDRSTYDGYHLLLVTHRNQRLRYQEMLERTRELRKRIQAVLTE